MTTERPAVSEAARTAALEARIRDEIVCSGPATFARFMELALYEPELGYYRQPADRPTDSGDFLTAPETHPIFGWTLARRIEALWTQLGEPQPYTIVEYGAGSGTLGLAILDGFRRHGSPLADAVRYEPIEPNPHRRADLEGRFEVEGRLDRVVRPDASDAGRSGAAARVDGLVLANEFLDALPVHRVIRRDGHLRELFVEWRDGFVEVPAEPSTPALAARLEEDGVELEEGQVAEVCLAIAGWLDEVAGRLERGHLLVIDYGYEAAELYAPRRRAGTLMAYEAHRAYGDPFEAVGRRDLTAHVDFTAFRRAAEARGFEVADDTTQSDFLVAAGLEAELRALQASPELTLDGYTRARSGIVRMLDPRAMGRFRVLLLSR